MAFPLFFFAAFAGGLSQLHEVPGFDFPLGYTAFQFVFVLLQAAAFGGVFTGFGAHNTVGTGFGGGCCAAIETAPHTSNTVTSPAVSFITTSASYARTM